MASGFYDPITGVYTEVDEATGMPIAQEPVAPPAQGPDMAADPQVYQAQPPAQEPVPPPPPVDDLGLGYQAAQPDYGMGSYVPPGNEIAPPQSTQAAPSYAPAPSGYAGYDPLSSAYTAPISAPPARDIGPLKPLPGAVSGQVGLATTSEALGRIGRPPVVNTGNGGGLGNIVRPSPEQSLAYRQGYQARREAGVPEGPPPSPYVVTDTIGKALGLDPTNREFDMRHQLHANVGDWFGDQLGMAGERTARTTGDILNTFATGAKNFVTAPIDALRAVVPSTAPSVPIDLTPSWQTTEDIFGPFGVNVRQAQASFDPIGRALREGVDLAGAVKDENVATIPPIQWWLDDGTKNYEAAVAGTAQPGATNQADAVQRDAEALIAFWEDHEAEISGLGATALMNVASNENVPDATRQRARAILARQAAKRIAGADVASLVPDLPSGGRGTPPAAPSGAPPSDRTSGSAAVAAPTPPLPARHTSMIAPPGQAVPVPWRARGGAIPAPPGDAVLAPDRRYDAVEAARAGAPAVRVPPPALPVTEAPIPAPPGGSPDRRLDALEQARGSTAVAPALGWRDRLVGMIPDVSLPAVNAPDRPEINTPGINVPTGEARDRLEAAIGEFRANSEDPYVFGIDTRTIGRPTVTPPARGAPATPAAQPAAPAATGIVLTGQNAPVAGLAGDWEDQIRAQGLDPKNMQEVKPGIKVVTDANGNAALIEDATGTWVPVPDDAAAAKKQAQDILAARQAAGAATTPGAQPAATAPVATGTADVALPLTTGTAAAGLAPVSAPVGTFISPPATTSNGDYTPRSSGDYQRSNSSGGYRRSSSGSSRSRRSKKTSKASSMFGEGFPFNRPDSPLRQQILAAIAASMGKAKSKKKGT
jgi:hypothetical protein